MKYTKDVVRSSDYYPFGVLLNERSENGGEYRYSYQGSEQDNEVKGKGNSYTTFFRQLDPRIGRWLSIDPKRTAWESPYVSMGNNPVLNNDIYGDSIKSGRSGDNNLSKKGEEILSKQLSDKTGLSLSFDKNGMLQFKKNKDGTPLVNEGNSSEAARDDLIQAINDKNFTLAIKWLENSSDVNWGQSQLRNLSSDWDFGVLRMDLGDKFASNKTFDFSMVFLHEMQHAYYGLSDSPKSDRTIIYSSFDKPEMYQGTGIHKLPPKGPTVMRVNVYREQMGLPIRMTYPSTYNGDLLFNDKKTITITNKRGKVKRKTINNYFYVK